MDIVLLIAAIGVGIAVGVVERRVERARRKVSEAPPSGLAHDLDPYELAYLSGGPRRAINTALTVLATAGAVRVSRGSHVTSVHGARPSPVPIEQAALSTLAASPGGYRAAELRRLLQSHPALTDLGSRLEARGLIVRDEAFDTAWQRREHLKVVAGLAGGLVILLVGLAVLDPAEKGIFFFLALLFAAGALANALVLYHRQGRRLRNVITREGREVLRSARLHHPIGARDSGSLAMSVGMPVALYGLAYSGDQMLCDELSVGDPGADCVGACGTHSGGDGATFGSDSYGGGDFGGGFGGGSSSCGSGSSSCGGGGSSCGGGGGCGGGGA